MFSEFTYVVALISPSISFNSQVIFHYNIWRKGWIFEKDFRTGYGMAVTLSQWLGVAVFEGRGFKGLESQSEPQNSFEPGRNHI